MCAVSVISACSSLKCVYRIATVATITAIMFLVLGSKSSCITPLPTHTHTAHTHTHTHTTHTHTHTQLLMDFGYSMVHTDRENQKPVDWADAMGQNICVRYLMMYETCWALSGELTHMAEQLAM